MPWLFPIGNADPTCPEPLSLALRHSTLAAGSSPGGVSLWAHRSPCDAAPQHWPCPDFTVKTRGRTEEQGAGSVGRLGRGAREGESETALERLPAAERSPGRLPALSSVSPSGRVLWGRPVPPLLGWSSSSAQGASVLSLSPLWLHPPSGT